MRAAPAPPVPRSTRSVTSAPCQVLGRLAARARRTAVRRRRAPRRRSARARDRGRSRRRRARRPRRAVPSSGSAPWTAVFTSGELAIARAAPLGLVVGRAAGHLDGDQLGRPFAAADDPEASGSQTRRSASTKTSAARRPSIVTPLAPLREREHAVVGRALAVDGDRVERDVGHRRQRALQQRRFDLRVRRHDGRAWSPSAARSCPSPWRCRRRGNRPRPS